MLEADDLDIDILVIITMQRSDTSTVSQPQIDGIWSMAQSNAGPGDIWLNIHKQRRILVSQIVILYEYQAVF